MLTVQRGLHSNPVDIDDSSHQGLVELAHAAGAVDGMDLDHALGQIDPHANGFTSNHSSCNLLHGTSPLNGFRSMTLNTTNLGALSPLPEGGKSLRIPIEGMPKRLRLLCTPHVKR